MQGIVPPGWTSSEPAMTKTVLALIVFAVTVAWFLWPHNAAPAKTPVQPTAGSHATSAVR